MVDKLAEGVRAWWPILLTTASIIATIAMTYGGLMARLGTIETQLNEARNAALEAKTQVVVSDAKVLGLIKEIQHLYDRQKMIEDLVNRR